MKREERIKPLDAMFRATETARARNLDEWQVAKATGFVKRAGKHIDAGGLVSRRGYRRIIPNDDTYWARDELCTMALRLSKKVLRGQERKIFQRKLISPLLDQPRITFAQLAKELGCSTAQAHKLLHRAGAKVSREWERELERERKATKILIAKYLKGLVMPRLK